MVTWLTKSTVTKYSSQTHVPDFKHKVFSNQNTKNSKSVLSLLSTKKKSKGLPNFLLSTTLNHAYR